MVCPAPAPPPKSPHRFQRVQSVFGWPCFFGTNGFNRAICSSVSQKRLLIITPSVRELESPGPGGIKPINGS